MYIIEFILKQFKKKPKKEKVYNPLSQEETTDYESCEHIFMPIDSTGEVLSCTKCGFLVKKNQLKKDNPFG